MDLVKVQLGGQRAAAQRLGLGTPAARTKLAFKGDDVLKGGRADNMPKSSFNPKALAEGAKVEREHFKGNKIPLEVASDHLSEFPNYYSALKKMEKRLEKRAGDRWRRLAYGVSGDTDPSEALNKRLETLSRPGDITVELSPRRTFADFMGRSDKTTPLARAVQTAGMKSLVGEGASHAGVVSIPSSRLHIHAPGPAETIFGYAKPTLVLRPTGASVSQGEAAASRAREFWQAAASGPLTGAQIMAIMNAPEEEAAALYEMFTNPPKGKAPRLHYDGRAEMDRRDFRNTLLANRLSDIPVVGAPAARAARGRLTRDLQPCNPASEVCSTFVGRAWEAPQAYGPNAKSILANTPELEGGLGHHFLSPTRLVRSPRLELVGANFDIDEALRRQPRNTFGNVIGSVFKRFRR